jgi:hypothetical protein
MTPLIADLGPWSWFILGVLLLAIEIVAPSPSPSSPSSR